MSQRKTSPKVYHIERLCRVIYSLNLSPEYAAPIAELCMCRTNNGLQRTLNCTRDTQTLSHKAISASQHTARSPRTIQGHPGHSRVIHHSTATAHNGLQQHPASQLYDVYLAATSGMQPHHICSHIKCAAASRAQSHCTYAAVRIAAARHLPCSRTMPTPHLQPQIRICSSNQQHNRMPDKSQTGLSRTPAVRHPRPLTRAPSTVWSREDPSTLSWNAPHKICWIAA